ncbi:MAG: phage tail sheath family protein [Lewinellaceae bacterium]|nr:phage tail sheath family protein [Lewinellaceae bacterium]
MAKIPSTPGVYISEKSAFPNSALPVSTAVPAFIGYTKKAIRNNKNLHNLPVRISSLGEYLLYFGDEPDTKYALAASADKQRMYELSTKTETRFLLYYSMKLFFDNGGSDCYIVSIGNYNSKPVLADFNGEITANGELFLKGIAALQKETEPTLLVIPDAMLLGEADRAALQQWMLQHCAKMASRFCILDVFTDENDTEKTDTQKLVQDFRENIGNDNLMWGAAYYPWLHTNITNTDAVNFRHIDRGSWDNLIALLLAEVDENESKGLDKKRADVLKTEIKAINDAAMEDANGLDKAAVSSDNTLHHTLLAISPLYKSIMTALCEKLNLLPSSAGIAGVYCMVDNQVGVFKEPANVSLSSVIRPAVNINHEEQEDLNVPLNGKAVNAIRSFQGQGVLIWGARTLDGNSQDWRYVNVRRTVIFIEQSIKYAMEAYVFEPNDSNTWLTVKSMVANFLTTVWKSGGLAGSTPEDAFSVDIGLGSTMTAVDILDGIMNITVKIAVTRPAEFIVISLHQKVGQS